MEVPDDDLFSGAGHEVVSSLRKVRLKRPNLPSVPLQSLQKLPSGTHNPYRILRRRHRTLAGYFV